MEALQDAPGCIDLLRACVGSVAGRETAPQGPGGQVASPRRFPEGFSNAIDDGVEFVAGVNVQLVELRVGDAELPRL
ncbi:hypothetical protein ADL04_01420 [Streptomyces sp. NRRL B-3648]|nr:hypothetical protein ADL04_01420 [Streptomyces sp. NRRL B-3648]